jgi:hypothetical protein
MKKIKEYVLGCACVLLTLTLIYMAFVGPKTVEINEKKFACTATEPHGLEARCIAYAMINGVR